MIVFSEKVTVTLRAGLETALRLPRGGSLRLIPALAGARYLAGSAAIARRRAAAAGPRQVTASWALALRAPSRAAVKRNEFGPGWSLAGIEKAPSAFGLTAMRVPSGPSM